MTQNQGNIVPKEWPSFYLTSFQNKILEEFERLKMVASNH